MVQSKNIAGMSMKGGRKDNFFFCLIEYYESSQRWFLRSLLQVKDEEGLEGDDAIRSWIEDYSVKQLVVDFPLTWPACHSCQLDCPGSDKCPVESVTSVKQRIEAILEEDKEIHANHPKAYERNRNNDDEVDKGRDFWDKESHEHLLSRSFKRRLKKGFLPYWNRSADYWIWKYYYDQYLELFNSSYDSFGNTSLMILSRFSYLRRHFPKNIDLYEGNVNLTLIELMRSKNLLKRDILNMSDIELGIDARLDIIKKIEARLNIFIYDHDLELIIKNPRAFDSFILAVTGQRNLLEKVRDLPPWTNPEKTRILVPDFSL
ncbi:hypothetical protein [Halobacteriovorax sp. HLS]|uniref:hypothetical protein n=1 Tax=Halobacteriovorax sp. HLS TaxID=2234000 RepID=UPI000FDB7431|nr:hypothetical protein [Halobacteriovorax sp. HLS]